VFGDLTADEFYNCYDIPCDLSKIDDYLAKRMPVIALVDFDLIPSTGVQTHFVLIIGREEDGAYYCNDPWTGETYYFHAKYGDPKKFIYGLRLYSGTPKEGEALDDKVSDLQDKLKACNEAVAAKSLEVNTLRDELETQERDNKNLADQLVAARSERDKEAWAKEQLEAKNKTLLEEVEKLKREKKELKVRIDVLKKSIFEGLTKWEALALTIGKFLKRKEKGGENIDG